jgi:hypothetical protein
VFVLLAAFYLGQYTFETKYVDGYRDDLAFMKQVRGWVPAAAPVFIKFDDVGPLETCWLFFYSDDRAVLLSDWTDLGPQREGRREAWVLARGRERAGLEAFGPVEVALTSKHTKGEHSPADRRTLFHVRFPDRAAPETGLQTGASRDGRAARTSGV